MIKISVKHVLLCILSFVSYVPTFGQGCYVPTLTTPFPVGPTSIGLQWYSNPGDVHDLQWRKKGSTDWNFVSNIGTGYFLYSNVYDISKLTPNTQYEWRARKRCSDGTLTAYSAIRTETTTSCLPPTDVSELRSISSLLNITWRIGNIGNSEYATRSYVIKWKKPNESTWSQPIHSSENSVIIRELDSSTNYEVAVQTVCSSTSQSMFTSPVIIKTLPCNRYVRQPELSVGIHSVKQIDELPFDDYIIQWRKQNENIWLQKSQITTAITLDSLLPETVYDVRVGIQCARSEAPYYSLTQQFTTVACSNVAADDILLSSSVVTTSPSETRVSWNVSPANKAMIYALRYRIAGTTDWTLFRNISNTLNLYNLLPETNYEWQVATVCELNIDRLSGFSDTRTFVTASDPAGTTVYNLSTGLWSTASNWSSRRVPNRNDRVQIRHPLIFQKGYMGRASSVEFISGGWIIYDHRGGNTLMVGHP